MKEQISIAVPVASQRQVSIQWASCLRDIVSPPGVKVSMQYIHGLPVDQARDRLVKGAQEDGSTHIFFLDDDVIPAPDALVRLWIHWKTRGWKVVAGQYGMRGGTTGILVDIFKKDGKRGCPFARADIAAGRGVITAPEISTGLGLCLIHMDVFKDLSAPYFYFAPGNDGLGEDINFFDAAKKAGHPLYIDRDVRGAHVTQAIVNHLGEIKPLTTENIEQTWGPLWTQAPQKP